MESDCKNVEKVSQTTENNETSVDEVEKQVSQSTDVKLEGSEFKVPKGNVVKSTDPSSSTKKSGDKHKTAKHLKEIAINPLEWVTMPGYKTVLSEIKEGVIIKMTRLIKPYYTFGRREGNDFVMANPTVSRKHAVLLYGDPVESGRNSWYIQDLHSSHGTFVNKRKIFGYMKLEDGYIFKLGCSTRLFLLEIQKKSVSTSTSSETSSSHSKSSTASSGYVNELESEEESEDEGNEWFQEFDPNLINSLKQWFQNEGQTPDFVIEESSDNHFECKIKLPLKEVYGLDEEDFEGVGNGKSKTEATYEAACKCWDHLSNYGVTPHGMKRTKNWKENDYYDSDEDPFFDRTGELEKKRYKRMKKEEKSKSLTESRMASYLAEKGNVVEFILHLQNEIVKREETDLDDDVDGYKKDCIEALAKKQNELHDLDMKIKLCEEKTPDH